MSVNTLSTTYFESILVYQFACCQTHPDLPDLQGWYLIVKPGDMGTLMELHEGVARRFFCMFALDPHLPQEKCPGFYSPVVLAAGWLVTIEKYLLEGVIVAVNSRGGMLPLAEVKVLSTIESEEMRWPNIIEDERITISRWPEGRHFYLSSNRSRIFVPSKYNEYAAAFRAAKKYTNNIVSKDL